MPDAIVATALVPRLRGTPVVLDVHDTFPELFATKFARPEDDPLVRLLCLEERVSAACASHVLVVTAQARNRLEDRGVGLGRTTVVMNSPDERVFGAPRPPVPWPRGGAVANPLPRRPGAPLRRGDRDPRGGSARRAPGRGRRGVGPRRAPARVRLRRGSRAARGTRCGGGAGARGCGARARALRADPRRTGTRAHRRGAHAPRLLHRAAAAGEAVGVRAHGAARGLLAAAVHLRLLPRGRAEDVHRGRPRGSGARAGRAVPRPRRRARARRAGHAHAASRSRGSASGRATWR